MGRELMLSTTPDPGRVKLETGPRTGGSATSLAERAFAGLFTNWSLLALGCIHHVAVPKGTPVYAGTLSQVVGGISGAAVRGQCPRGTGWPAGGMR